MLLTTFDWDELPNISMEERIGLSELEKIPSGDRYIRLCGWSRVFIADPKVADDFRVKNRRYIHRGHPNGYVSADNYADTRDYASSRGERLRMNVLPPWAWL